MGGRACSEPALCSALAGMDPVKGDRQSADGCAASDGLVGSRSRTPGRANNPERGMSKGSDGLRRAAVANMVARCGDAEAQDGGGALATSFLHELPTPFSAASPPAASPHTPDPPAAAPGARKPPTGSPHARTTPAGHTGGAPWVPRGRFRSRTESEGPAGGHATPPGGMRRWESGTSWVLERLWDFLSPSGDAPGRSGSRALPEEGDGAADCSDGEGLGGLGLAGTARLERGISQRFPVFLTPTGLASEVPRMVVHNIDHIL